MNREPPQSPAELLASALAEARKGLGLTAPNPPVGAVVTDAAGHILGRGHHRRAGAPHAEVEAIADAAQSHGADALAGGSIFVTLEPCSTSGRTPPCCHAIRDAGIRNVFWGTRDPNPLHAGRAANLLAESDIAVAEASTFAPETARACHALIRPFAKWVTKNLPWVVAKVAASLDGRITRPPGESPWITSPAAREDAHFLRAESDAILVGAHTVRTDDPALTIRGPASRPEKTQPWRAVTTRSGNLPPNARIFTDPFRDRTLVFQNRTLTDVLSDLASRGCLSVLVEGGADLLGQLLHAALIDEFCFYLAPRICGAGTPAIGSLAFPDHAASWIVQNPEISVLDGSNIRVRGLAAQEAPSP